MKRYLAAAMILSASQCLADEGPSFDCSKASGTVETTICNTPALGALDAKMDGYYTRAEAQAGDSKDLVAATQRVWLGQRDGCASSTDVPQCLTTSYNQRIAHLVARWNLEKPFATAEWDCDGAKLTTVFYTTQAPSMRAEFNGGTEVMLQAMSGSGARYTNDALGSSFWEKGPEASFEWKHGASMSCKERN